MKAPECCEWASFRTRYLGWKPHLASFGCVALGQLLHLSVPRVACLLSAQGSGEGREHVQSPGAGTY